jgi:predicted lipoprotein with Yx(FWY)xxD motif
MSKLHTSLKALLLAGVSLLIFPLLIAASGGPAGEIALPARLAAAPSYSVQLRFIPGLGNILVGEDGMTLYAFLKDSPGVSTCSGACATLWPPEQIDIGLAPTVAPEVTAKVEVLVMSDETAMLTVNGMPVYNYSLDKVPGAVLGQGFKGNWYVLSSSGALIKVSFGLMGPGAETPVP